MLSVLRTQIYGKQFSMKREGRPLDCSTEIFNHSCTDLFLLLWSLFQMQNAHCLSLLPDLSFYLFFKTVFCNYKENYQTAIIVNYDIVMLAER